MASHEKGFTAPGSVADSHCIPVLARRHGASWHNAGRNLLLVQNYYIFFVPDEKTLFSVSFLSKINLLGFYDNRDNRNNRKNGRNIECHEVTYNKYN